MFTTLIENKLLFSETSQYLNFQVLRYIKKMEPLIKSEWEGNFLNRIFGSNDMNKGIYKEIHFDDVKLVTNSELYGIISHAHDLLLQNGFRVKEYEGIVVIDLFEINSMIPVDHRYKIDCDNRFGNDYETCVFFARKDEGVKGDLEIYIEVPSFFSNGKKMIVPTKTALTLLRSGSIDYRYEKHMGNGKYYILSVHLLRDS